MSITVWRNGKITVEIKIDYDKCTGCKKCVESCAFSVLEWFEGRPIVANPINCAACFECQSNCPANAISVKEK